MIFMQRFIQTRAFQISLLILIGFAIVCTRIPLFNYLGFEFSVFTVLLAGFISGLLTLSLWKQADCECKADVWRFIGEVAFVQFILLVIPFLISLVNVLFVKNCSIGDGMVLYVLTVVPGVLFSVALAMVVGIVFEKWRKTIFTVLYILVLLHIPLVTFFCPQIFAFNPIVGFFPGFTYDETLQVTQRLLIYRLAIFAVSGCLVTAAVWIWHIRYLRKERSDASQQSFPFIEIVILALLVPIVLVMISFSDRLGFSSSKQYIQQKLVGNYRTEHFEIVYPAGSVKREKIEQLGRLHEFYYDQISHNLNVRSKERIVSFLYSSPEEKGKLMGAGSTNISKPWLRQIHVNLANAGAVLKHEMVHILAGEFGWSPLRISHNSGLVEGIAVAVGDDTWYDEPLHRSAALVFAAGITPDMKSVFSLSGFAQEYAGVSYTLAGSFCKFLIDSFGVEKFKQLYATGDFLQAYQRDFSLLIADWEQMIHSQQLTAIDSIKARYFFRHSSIFGKECARVIANINSETKDLLARRDFEKALVSAEKSLSLSKTSQAVFQKSAVLFELRRFKEVALFCTAQFHDTTIGPLLLPLHLHLGDSYWAMDSLNEAKREYETLADLHLGAGYDEACALRLESIKNDRERGQLQVYFTRSMEDTNRIEWLSRLSSSFAQYLLARELAGKEKYSDARSILEQMSPSDFKPFEFFYLQRLGKVYFLTREWKKAGTLFEKALPIAPTSSLEIEIKEWIERCKFELKQSSEGSQSSIK
jgi:tetratricopeptide (TPR) repeat protein